MELLMKLSNITSKISNHFGNIKKQYALCVLLFLCAAYEAAAQSRDITPVSSVIREYFRVDPYEGSFKAFFHALRNDTALLKNEEVLKTDSTDYGLIGEYKYFNPFRIKARKVQMRLLQSSFLQQTLLNRDSLVELNYYNYVIIGEFDFTGPHRKVVLQQVKKITNKWKKEYVLKGQTEMKGNGIEEGFTYNFAKAERFEPTDYITWYRTSSNKLFIIINHLLADNLLISY